MVALARAGIEVGEYHAFEIDKYAIKVSENNHPQIKQYGDVLESDFSRFRGIDIIIGGSPCQGFSFAGKQLNFEDPRSKLFFEYVRAIEEAKPRFFLLENVVMAKESENIISEMLGVKPIQINSSLVSGQNRKRLYWSNIQGINQPHDKQIFFGDIREHCVEQKNMYYTQKGLEWIRRHSERTGKRLRIISDTDKAQMLEASMYKKYSAQRFFGIEDIYGLRYITPTECERCQTLPDGYTNFVSDTQRYKQLGNGWTVDVIAHIFENLPHIYKKKINNQISA